MCTQTIRRDHHSYETCAPHTCAPQSQGLCNNRLTTSARHMCTQTLRRDHHSYETCAPHTCAPQSQGMCNNRLTTRARHTCTQTIRRDHHSCKMRAPHTCVATESKHVHHTCASNSSGNLRQQASRNAPCSLNINSWVIWYMMHTASKHSHNRTLRDLIGTLQAYTHTIRHCVIW